VGKAVGAREGIKVGTLLGDTVGAMVGFGQQVVANPILRLNTHALSFTVALKVTVVVEEVVV
jgi:hypothetical protein